MRLLLAACWELRVKQLQLLTADAVLQADQPVWGRLVLQLLRPALMCLGVGRVLLVPAL